MQTLKFKALVAVRELDERIDRQPLPLVIAHDLAIPSIDLENDDVLFSTVDETSQMCDPATSRPWRGPKQKSDALLKVFISGLSPVNGIVVDFNAGVGEFLFSIH